MKTSLPPAPGSCRCELEETALRRGIFLATLAIGAVGPLVASVAALADASYNAQINQGNVPATAAGYSQSCNSDEFGSKQPTQDGWLFVASPSNFTAFEADFGSTKVVLGGSNPDGTSFYFTKSNDHLALITPAGWELTDAYANLNGDKDFFTLSHTCAAQSPQQSSESANDRQNGDDNGSSSSAGSTSTTAADDDASGSESGGAVVSGQSSSNTPVPTRVLGEKLTKPSSTQGGSIASGATTAGESTGPAALPFTGFVAAHLFLMGCVMLGGGFLLTTVARRRRRAG